MSQYSIFNVRRLQLLPLNERKHDLSGNFFLPLQKVETSHAHLQAAARAMHQAKQDEKNIIFMCGAHVIRAGVQNYLFDLMQNGFISCIAFNGAGIIHDFEIALIGATTESVATYIPKGKFGMWRESGYLNDIINHPSNQNLGLGELVGKTIAQGNYPFKHNSILSKAWELNIPVTVHVGIGYDFIHAHPNFDPKTTAQASYRDFLIFANILENLGVIATFGSAVMAPEVFLKALSMVRNANTHEGKTLSSFSSLVCDLQNLPEDVQEEAKKTDSRYYFRPWKTMLSRTIANTGKSWYVQDIHKNTIPQLWTEINKYSE